MSAACPPGEERGTISRTREVAASHVGRRPVTGTPARDRPRGGRVQEAADDARVSTRTAWAFIWLPVALTAAVLASVLHPPLFVFLTAEDSVLEWGQFTCFLAASLFGAAAAARLLPEQRAPGLLLAMFAVAAFLAAGEEISWGQRVFGWGTPASLASVNHQGETNLHNITAIPVQKTFNLLQLAAGLYGSVFAVACRAVLRRRPFLVDLLLPALFLAPCFFLMFAYRFARLTVLTEMRFVLVKVGELPELTLALGLAGFAFVAMRRAVPPTGPDAKDPGDARATGPSPGSRATGQAGSAVTPPGT